MTLDSWSNRSQPTHLTRCKPDDSNCVQLYELVSDPSETTDVKGEQPAVLARLMAALRAANASAVPAWICTAPTGAQKVDGVLMPNDVPKEAYYEVLSSRRVLRAANAAISARLLKSTDEAAVWSSGSAKGLQVIVFANGAYNLSMGGRGWMSGTVEQTLVLPLKLSGVPRLVHGSHPTLGAFHGVELTVKGTDALDRFAAEKDLQPPLEEPNATEPPATCGALEPNTDYHDKRFDIRFVSNVTSPSVCCAACLKEPLCACYSLMGAADKGTAWADRCYLKSSCLKGTKFKTHTSAKVPGRKPPPPPPPGPPPSPPLPPPPPGTAIEVVFTLRYFAAQELFLWEQKYPSGLNFKLLRTDRERESGAHKGKPPSVQMLAEFPRFSAFSSALPSPLGAVYWSGAMSGGNSQLLPSVHAANLHLDSPLVLFDAAAAQGNTLVLSAYDKFGHQHVEFSGGVLGSGPEIGHAPAAKSVCKGYTATAALRGGTGGVNRVTASWGAAVRAGKNTSRPWDVVQAAVYPRGDPLTHNVGYWTDNVAYYDWYNYPGAAGGGAAGAAGAAGDGAWCLVLVLLSLY